MRPPERNFVLLLVMMLLVAGCSITGSPSADGPADLVSLPAPAAGAVTFYLSLPASVADLAAAAV